MGTVFLYLAPFIGFIIDSMCSRGAPDINGLHYTHDACCVVEYNLLFLTVHVSLVSLFLANKLNI